MHKNAQFQITLNRDNSKRYNDSRFAVILFSLCTCVNCCISGLERRGFPTGKIEYHRGADEKLRAEIFEQSMENHRVNRLRRDKNSRRLNCLQVAFRETRRRVIFHLFPSFPRKT